MAVFETRSANKQTAYRVKIRLRGHPDVSQTFSRLTDARHWATATEAAIRENRYFKTAEANKHTLEETIDRYIEDVLPSKPKNASNTKLHLLWWKKTLGSYLLADVTPPRIVEAYTKLGKKITQHGTPMAPATVRRYLAAISHLFTVAVNDWGWANENPLSKVTKPKEARGRTRFLNDAERDAFLGACRASTSQFLLPVVLLAIATGMRRGEILGLTWSAVDLAREEILLVETKNGTQRSVPISGVVLQAIKKLHESRQTNAKLVFPNTSGKRPIDLKTPWTTALKNSELENFRFHDLRHTAASYLAMNGATTLEIADILGHKTLQMVKRYSHLSNSHKASVLRSMNEKMFGANNA